MYVMVDCILQKPWEPRVNMCTLWSTVSSRNPGNLGLTCVRYGRLSSRNPGNVGLTCVRYGRPVAFLHYPRDFHFLTMLWVFYMPFVYLIILYRHCTLRRWQSHETDEISFHTNNFMGLTELGKVTLSSFKAYNNRNIPLINVS